MIKHVICLGSLLLPALSGCSGSSEGLSSPDPATRARAIRSVAAEDNEQAVERLAPIVRHEDAKIASDAIAALGRMSSSRACQTLKDVAVSEPRAELRKWAVVSLAQRQEPEAAQVLRQLAATDPAPEVRGEAAVGLARAGSLDDVNLLVRAASTEADPWVTRCQVTALSRIIGVHFEYDPNAPPEVRKAKLALICSEATRLWNVRKGALPPDVTHSRRR